MNSTFHFPGFEPFFDFEKPAQPGVPKIAHPGTKTTPYLRKFLKFLNETSESVTGSNPRFHSVLREFHVKRKR